MRLPIVLALAAILAFVPTSGAESFIVLDDAADDDGIWGGAELTASEGFGPGLGALADCSSPAADIHQISVYSDGETLFLSMRVEAFSLEVTCSIVTASDLASGARYGLRFDSRIDDGAEGVVQLAASAWTTGFGMGSCLEIGFLDAGSACMGQASADNGSLYWSVPLQGTTEVAVDSELTDAEPTFETREYDLRGVEFVARASSFVRFEQTGGLGFAGISDATERTEPFTL